MRQCGNDEFLNKGWRGMGLEVESNNTRDLVMPADRPIGTPPVTPHHLPHLLFTYPVPVETVSTLTLSAPLVELRLRPPWLPLSSFFTATAFLEAAVEAQACTLKFLKAVQKHTPMSAAAL